MSVKLVKILDFANDIDIDLGVLGDMVDVSLEELSHASTHRCRVCVPIEPSSLQGEVACHEIPRI